jgi:phosphatidylserine decarboxylase
VAGNQSIIETIFDTLAPVHADGHKFVAIGALATLAFFFVYPPIGWIAAGLTAYVAYFFRDPARITPVRSGFVISGADGKVSAVEAVRPPQELGFGPEERVRISTFLSVFDVHINRAPVAGKIARSIYIPGKFINAAADKASEDNERRAMVIAMDDGTEIGVVQIAGFVARRIVAFKQDGESLQTGERYGLIRFGSRVDIYLPPGKHALVSVGQRAVAGETIFADLNSSEPEREVRSA